MANREADQVGRANAVAPQTGRESIVLPTPPAASFHHALPNPGFDEASPSTWLGN